MSYLQRLENEIRRNEITTKKRRRGLSDITNLHSKKHSNFYQKQDRPDVSDEAPEGDGKGLSVSRIIDLKIKKSVEQKQKQEQANGSSNKEKTISNLDSLIKLSKHKTDPSRASNVPLKSRQNRKNDSNSLLLSDSNALSTQAHKEQMKITNWFEATDFRYLIFPSTTGSATTGLPPQYEIHDFKKVNEWVYMVQLSSICTSNTADSPNTNSINVMLNRARQNQTKENDFFRDKESHLKGCKIYLYDDLTTKESMMTTIDDEYNETTITYYDKWHIFL